MKTQTQSLVLTIAAAVVFAGGAVATGRDRPANRKSERESVLVVVAHPDDTIACAGTLLLLKDRYDIHQFDVTRGDRGSDEVAARRMKEEEAAAAMLGARLYWGSEKDGEAYAGRETCQQVAEIIRKVRPRAIFAHSPLERHPDHAISSAIVGKAIDLAGLRDRIELYFMEEAFDSRSFIPAHYVDITEVLDQKRAYIRKSASENWHDGMCRDEILESLMRGQRLANWVHHEYGCVPEINGQVRIAAAERFAERDGKPQGSRCIFNEMALPKGGWNQSWDDPAKLW